MLENQSNINNQIKDDLEPDDYNVDLDNYIKALDVKVGENGENKEALKALLKISLECRENEIKRYWSRGAYFWVFIAFIFTAYFTILSLERDFIVIDLFYGLKLSLKKIILTALAFIGLLFSLIWIFVNLSSKYWQTNWEFHSEYLSKAIYGNIFGVIKKQEKFILYSVSKLNITLNLTIFLFWCIIYIVSLIYFFGVVTYIIVLIVTFAICLLLSKSKSDSKEKTDIQWYIKK